MSNEISSNSSLFWYTNKRNIERNTCAHCGLDFNEIGHLQDGVILLLRPESFSFFFSYLNLVMPARFK